MKADEILAQVLDRIEKEVLRIQENHPMPSSDAAETIRVLEEIIFDATKDGSKPKYDKKNLVQNEDGTYKCIVLYQMMLDFHAEYKTKVNYPKQLYVDFLNHWSTPNERGIPAWLTEKLKPKGRFHLPGRLRTWANRPWNKYSTKEETQPIKNIPDDAKMKFV